MVLNLREYRFRGARAEGEGRTLGEAVDRLSRFWDSRPSLVMHNWGTLKLAINIGGEEAVFEVTDPHVLDELEHGDTAPFIDWLAEKMDIDPEDAEEILDHSTHVVAAVDKIRPQNQTWSPDPGMSPFDVLPDATTTWVGSVQKELDREVSRRKGRPRSRKQRRLIEAAVEQASRRGLSIREISEDTGLPPSTVRDAKMRVDRQKVVVKEFQARRKGQRLTDNQKSLILDTLTETSGNAAETARRLGIPARTVRGLRQRNRATLKRNRRSKYTELERTQVAKLVEQGVSATEAGRQVGVPGRTARRWMAKK